MMRLPVRLTLVVFAVFLSGYASARHLRAAAQNGDGHYSLLRRYLLVDHACNITEFRQLNGLRPNSQLIKGREYVLPVEVYDYNGESIRSTTGNNDWDRASAIKHYNLALWRAGLKGDDYRQDGKLYVPYHVDHCAGGGAAEPTVVSQLGEPQSDRIKNQAAERLPTKVPEQPTVTGYRTFAIFGEKYEKVPLLDRSLDGQVFYIVAGHGGPDPGSVGRRGGRQLPEDEYAYDVALRLCRNILQRGGVPYMIVRDENDGIRDDKYLRADKDETVWGGARLPRNQKARLFQRSDIINALYDENKAKGVARQTMISIHVDSRHRSQRIDVFVYYPQGDPVGRARAEQVNRTFRRKYDELRPGRGYHGTVSHRDLHMLRETKPSGIFVELGNIANANDQQRIINPRNRQLLADWLLESLYD